jgi:L-rhamnose mutarotase
MNVHRYGSSIGLRPDLREEYLRLHRAVWPEVESALWAGNVRNYTIFRHGDRLFGYYEYIGDDHALDQARIAADPATQRWWQLTDPCQERLPGTPDGQQWLPLTEVWHLSGGGG